MSDFISLDLFIRLIINLVSVSLLVRLIYYPNYRRTDLFTTYFAFNLVIFMITFLLQEVDMSLGAAFGLFAVFSMLRYRTEQVSIKDMTYLFLAIALGLLSAVSQSGWEGLCIFNSIILGVTSILESNWLIRREMRKTVLYENIHLIVPEKRAELLADLKQRTGMNIHRVDIEGIDFLRDATRLTVYYYP
ncbi:DUF4956 domain-containing protein [Persicitalea sp.]|uniref:DUF4956 domain-containing protein n=1 Tax=Persicitalea sp. TaxID=3100273 RepID=UPI0035932E7B